MIKLAAIKDRLVKLYNDVKALDEMPMRMIQGEFYEEKKVEVRVKRQNNVSVEDLRPKR
jgi:hypothetical protein